MVHNPKTARYEGDLKGLLVAEIEGLRHELGLDRLTYRVRQDPHRPHVLIGEYVPVMSQEDVVDTVERIVGGRISELVKFNTDVSMLR